MFSVQDSVVHARGVLRDFKGKRRMIQATSQIHERRYLAQESLWSFVL